MVALLTGELGLVLCGGVLLQAEIAIALTKERVKSIKNVLLFTRFWRGFLSIWLMKEIIAGMKVDKK
jgi:hypothetical protein